MCLGLVIRICIIPNIHINTHKIGVLLCILGTHTFIKLDLSTGASKQNYGKYYPNRHFSFHNTLINTDALFDLK